MTSGNAEHMDCNGPESPGKTGSTRTGHQQYNFWTGQRPEGPCKDRPAPPVTNRFVPHQAVRLNSERAQTQVYNLMAGSHLQTGSPLAEVERYLWIESLRSSVQPVLGSSARTRFAPCLCQAWRTKRPLPNRTASCAHLQNRRERSSTWDGSATLPTPSDGHIPPRPRSR